MLKKVTSSTMSMILALSVFLGCMCAYNPEYARATDVLENPEAAAPAEEAPATEAAPAPEAAPAEEAAPEAEPAAEAAPSEWAEEGEATQDAQEPAAEELEQQSPNSDFAEEAVGPAAEAPEANEEEAASSAIEDENKEAKEAEKSKDAKDDEKPAFDASETVDGVRVTVKAEEGTFPKGATLSVKKVSATEESKAEAAVEEQRDENANVVASYTFDIKVLDKDGNEVQPAEGKKVEVLFTAEEIANQNLETSVYHIKEEAGLVAESLDTTERGDTVAAETSGFSYYTVEFTYGDLQYSMRGDSEVALQDILANVGISGTATAATSSNPDLFSVEQQDGEFVVVAKKAFKSNEALTVSVDGIDYVIKVTDAVTYYTSQTGANVPALQEGDTLIVDTTTTTQYKLTVSGDNVTVTINAGCKFNLASSYKNLTIQNKGFTLNLKNGATFNGTRTGINYLYLNGEDATVNLYGTTTTNNTKFRFRGKNGVLNIDSSSSDQQGLDLAMGGESTINVQGTMYASSGSPYFLVEEGGKCVINLYGTINTTLNKVDTGGELIVAGKNDTAEIKHKSGNFLSNLGKLTVKDLTWNGNSVSGVMLLNTLEDSNTLFENIIVKNIGSIGPNNPLFAVRGNVELKNVEVDLPGTAITNSVFKFDNTNGSLLMDNCRFENLDNGDKGIAKLSYGGTVTIKDTVITNCKSGVLLDNLPSGASAGGVLTLSGNTVIDGNENYNIYLGDGRVFTVTEDFNGVAGVTTNSLPTTDSPIQITTDGTQHVANIFSDKEGYSVGIETGGAEGDHHVLMIHEHDWAYALGKTKTDGDTLMAWCAAAGQNPQCLYHWEEGATDDSRVKLSIDTKDGEKAYIYDETNPVARPAVLKNRELFIETTGASVGEIMYYSGDTELGGVPKDKGKYTAKAVVTKGSQTYTIQTSYKIKGSSPVPEPTKPTYNGQAQALLTIEPDDEYTVLYSTTGEAEGAWSTDIPKGTNAGSYDVWFMYQGDPDSIEKIDDVTIEKAAVTVSGITASNKMYDGNTDATVNTEGATFTGKIDGDKLTVSTTGSFDDKNVGTDKVVTLGALTLGGESVDNYKLAETGHQSTAEADITKCPVKVSGITAEDKDYDGNTDATLITSGATFTGIVGEDVLTVIATGAFVDASAGKDKTVNISGLTLSGTDVGNYELASEGQQSTATATIRALPMTVSATGYTGTYDESNHRIAVTVTVPTSGYTITYKGPEDQEYSAANPEFQDPGEYEVSYKVTADNYEETTGTATVKIIGADFVGITSSAYAGIYDGAAHGITVNVPDNYSDYNISYSEAEAGPYTTSSIEYTDFTDGAKTVYFKVSKKGYNDFKGSNTVSITKRDVTITAENKASIYGEDITELTYSVTEGSVVDGDTLKIALATDASKTTNVGTYDITPSWEVVDANYNATFAKGTYTITQREIGLEWGSTTLTYTGENQAPTATATNLVNNDTCAVTVDGAKKDTNIKSGETSYTATASALGNPNYKLPENKTQSFTISPKEIKVSGIKADDKTYDKKKDATLTYRDVVLEGIVEGDKLGVEAKGTFDDVNAGTDKNVSISDLVLTGDDKDNYILATEGQQKSAVAKILQKVVNVIAEAKEKEFGSNDPEFTYKADELIEGDEYTDALSRVEGEDVGKYDINQGTLSAGNNYLINYTKAQLEIVKASLNKVTVSVEGWTYGDAPKTPVATANFGGDTATFSYSDKEDGTYTDVVPTNAGTWYVKATVQGTENYVGAESEPVEFTIAQKPITPAMLSLDKETIKNNGTSQGPVITLTDGTVLAEEQDYTLSGETTSDKTGTHFFTVVGAGNYTGSFETSWVMFENKQNAATEEGKDGAGNIEIFVDIIGNTESVSVDNLTIDFAKGLLSEEDLNKKAEGANIILYVELAEVATSAVPDVDRALLSGYFAGKSATDIRWFDITVWKKVGNNPAEQIHELNSALDMTIAVPDEYKDAPENFTRAFYFVTAHNGQISLLAETQDKVVAFSTKEFSTFALGYKDTEAEDPSTDPGEGDDEGTDPGQGGGEGTDPGQGGNKGGNKGSNTTKSPAITAKAAAKATTAKTADSANVPVLTCLALVSSLLLAVAALRRRKEEEAK